MDAIYFVYVIELLDGTPLYFGKGKNNRPDDHFHPRATSYIANKIRKEGKEKVQVRKLHEQLDRDTAFALEMAYIAKHGRKDIGTGILYNRSIGGEGSRGHRMTPEGIERLRQLNLGKKLSVETKALLSSMFKGRKCTWGNKIAISLTGQQHTEERKRKVSIAAVTRCSKMTAEERRERMKRVAACIDRTKPNPMAKRCSVNGIEYANVSEAALMLKWSRRRVRDHETFSYLHSIS
jgi:hypothetical protein